MSWCRIFRHLSCLSSCDWYVMTICYHLTILQDLLRRSLLGLLHIMLLPQIGCKFHCLSLFLSLPNNNHPCGLFFRSCFIPCWSRAFLQSYFSFYFRFCFPNSLTLCGSTCHTCCIHPWRTFCSFFYISFLQRVMLEPYVLVLLFLFCFFCSDLSSRTNVFISSGL